MSLAAVDDGMNRMQAARIGGNDRQTLRHWVLRFMPMGRRGCRPWWCCPARRRNDYQLRELAGIVEAGPDVHSDGVVRWRRVDRQVLIKECFGVAYGERWDRRSWTILALPT